MKTKTFSFDLPEELIAQEPVRKRGTSRLMQLDRSSGKISHYHISDLSELLPSDSLLVLNNSRVRKARLFGLTENGGKVEFLLLSQNENGVWKCMVSKAKKQKIGKQYSFPGDVGGTIVGSEGEFRFISFDPEIDDGYLESHGHMPLPPYIKRQDTADDSERYQTVYAQKTGSVAAPTAGLHLTESIISELKGRGIDIVTLTLHVGIGTFLPIRTEEVESHRMHREEYYISPESAEKLNHAKKNQKPICAVGTTSVRTLESAWTEQGFREGEGATELFIYPGYEFKAVDMMLTNFHTPESSLLVMVSAFAGKDLIETSYHEAIRQRYRFFSYGDAMLIR